MPFYPHILSEIARTPWAIMPSSLRAIVGAAEGKLSAADYPSFHGADPDAQVAVSEQLGTKSDGARLSSVRDGIGILQLNGPIVPRGDAFTDMSGLTSIDRLSAEFSALAVDPNVKHILLLIDSPGGAITGISEFASMIDTSEKPVTAYVYGNAASAAYWIASAADEIIVGATSMVGSIGVVMSGRKLEDGEWELVNSDSPNKRPDHDTTEGRAEIKRMLNGLADVFVETVARNRNTTPGAVVKNFGRGGMVLPKDAIKIGMVDGQATLAAYLGELISGQPRDGVLGRESGERESGERESGERESRERNLFDSPPTVGGQQREESEFQGASPNPEESKMNLAEFLKEHPEAASEIDAMKAEAASAAAALARTETSEATNKRNAQASAILASDSYPASVKAVASAVIAGTKTAEYLETFVAAFDAMKAEQTVAGAVADSASAPATPPQKTDSPSADGVLRSPADIDAAAAAQRAGR
jgi:capsid assembly protease